MSWKRVVKEAARGRTSIAARLTVWYTVSSFILLTVASGFLYWAMSQQLSNEDDQFLANETQFVLQLLNEQASDPVRLKNSLKTSKLFHRQSQVFYRVLNSQGQAVLSVPENGPSMEWPSPSTDLGKARIDEIKSSSGKFFEVLSTPVVLNPALLSTLWIQVAMDRTHEELLLRKYRERLAATLGLLLILCAYFGHWIARRGIAPIQEIIRATKSIRSRTLHERIPETQFPSELLALVKTFNEMLDRLEISFLQVSQFSQDLAHELRTPINNLLGEVGVTLGRSRSTEEYRVVLESSLEEYDKLSNMIESLLFLAHAENSSEGVHTEPLDLAKELRSIRDFFEASAVEAGVELSVAPSFNMISLPLDRTLFQRAMNNVLANSVAHTEPGGSIVILSEDAANDQVLIQIRDTGCGVAPEHLPYVFNRLYRVNRSRSTDKGNLGLGLSIVKSIVELHGGSVQIASHLGEGTTVSLLFPRFGKTTVI